MRPRSKCSACMSVSCGAEAGQLAGGLGKNQTSGHVILAEANACAVFAPEVANSAKSTWLRIVSLVGTTIVPTPGTVKNSLKRPCASNRHSVTCSATVLHVSVTDSPGRISVGEMANEVIAGGTGVGSVVGAGGRVEVAGAGVSLEGGGAGENRGDDSTGAVAEGARVTFAGEGIAVDTPTAVGEGASVSVAVAGGSRVEAGVGVAWVHPATPSASSRSSHRRRIITLDYTPCPPDSSLSTSSAIFCAVRARRAASASPICS